MSNAMKERVHALVDTLPASELPAARRYLEFLREHGSDPYAHLDEQDPLESMSEEERQQLHSVLRESRAEHEQGLGIPAAEVMRRLRSR